MTITLWQENPFPFTFASLLGNKKTHGLSTLSFVMSNTSISALGLVALQRLAPTKTNTPI